MKRIIMLTLAAVIALTLLAGCAPSKNEGIALAETYLGYLANGDYEAAYELLSDFDKGNIDRETYLEWRELVARIITIKSASVDSQVDKFKDYKYQGALIGYALGLKISREQEVLIPEIDLDGYNQDFYRQMVVYENDEWKMLLLLTNLNETVAGYRALLDKYDNK